MKVKDLKLELLDGDAFGLEWWVEELKELDGEDEVEVPSLCIGELEELEELGLFGENRIVLKEILDVVSDVDDIEHAIEDGYTSIQVIGMDDIIILGGGEYDDKIELNDAQEKAFDELQEEFLVEYNPKYQDVYLIAPNVVFEEFVKEIV